jgi:hypothetical protein
MESKKFNCKMQDIPVIMGFALASMERDKPDFINYSPMFADPFMADVRIKQTECYEIVTAADVLNKQKMVKAQLDTSVGQLRVQLNKNEGYLKLAEKELDIKMEDFGIKGTRTALSKGDMEKTIAGGHTLVSNMKRNAAVLATKGLKQAGIDEMATLITEIDTLNEKHNTLKNDRSRAAGDNSAKLNEMWDLIGVIASAGRAMYKGVDPIKLKEYTISNLQKRVYNVSGKADTPAEAAKV